MSRTCSKKVICLETGDVFERVGDAAKFAGRKLCTMSRHLNGERASCGGLHFQFYEEWLETQEVKDAEVRSDGEEETIQGNESIS